MDDSTRFTRVTWNPTHPGVSGESWYAPPPASFSPPALLREPPDEITGNARPALRLIRGGGMGDAAPVARTA